MANTDLDIAELDTQSLFVEVEAGREARTELEHQSRIFADFRVQCDELKEMLRDQQSLDSRFELQLAERREHFTTDTNAEHLASLVTGLEMQLRTIQDENALLMDQMQTKEAHFKSEISRLAEQIARVPAAFQSTEPPTAAKLVGELETMRSMSANLSAALEDRAEMHARVVACERECGDEVSRITATMTERTSALDTICGIIGCTSANGIVEAVQALVFENDRARASVDERAAIERRVSELILANQRFRAQSDVLVEHRPSVSAPRKSLGNESEASICREIAVELTEVVTEPTVMSQLLVAMFEDISMGNDWHESLEKVAETAGSADPNGTIMVVIDALLESARERMTAHQNALEEINGRCGMLYSQVARLSAKQRDRTTVDRRSSIARKFAHPDQAGP